MLSSSNVAIRFDTTTMGAAYIVGVYFLVRQPKSDVNKSKGRGEFKLR